MWFPLISKGKMDFPSFCLGLALFRFTMIPKASAQTWTDPQTTYVTAGRNTSLSCAINVSLSSNTSNVLTWVDSGLSIFSGTNRITPVAKYDNFHVTLTGDGASVGSRLHITSAERADEGMLSCIYGDASQNVTSGVASLHVEAEPGVCNEDLYRRLAIAFGAITCLLFFVVALFIFLFQRLRRARLDTGKWEVPHTSGNGGTHEHVRNTRNNETSEREMSENDLPITVTTTERVPTAKQVGARVPSKNIRFYSQIGPIGALPFGQVWRGEIRGVPGKEKKKIEAAVRDLSGLEGVQDNLLEAVTALWELPDHINLVKCLGCCVEQAFIVYEYVLCGTLLTYLQTNAGKTRSSYRVYANVRSVVRRVKEPDLFTFAWQIAKGMAFLSSQKIVHGNLRASNVLLSKNKICKIADYGLTGITQTSKTVHRWLSPEAMLTGTCSTESDVWSYGVLLWELVTLGAQPYPGVSDCELTERITNGYIMRRPLHCGEDLFNIISDCWKIDTRQRSTFHDMQIKIGWILEGSNDYLSLNRMSDEDIYTDIPELE
ncbi:tyrosine kinase receptor Cad96Ca [Strongylocentrotus purpuratus]|uniref:Uncharacterized protein n=1 Tax=Strongylocentrotus purpuratus TaxID=7668 RepID=A0A7M7LL81_STRPU|nr:tyrosine kinase receptor Cad96Ca [Strongylocentrotus purpuratus]